MKAIFAGTGLALLVLAFGVATPAVAQAAPVAKLVQVEGDVQYSRNGTRWREVRKTKYLFAGYKIKTGRDGSGKLINQSDGKSQKLGPDSEIEIVDGKVMLIAGNLSKPEAESSSIWQGLMNKFARVQRYTTVRRSAGEADACNSKVRTIRSVTVSPQHPDLVWRNACPEYSYRLVIDGETTYEVPAQSTAEMIRFAVGEFKPGTHSYRVEVLDKDGTVYIPRKDSNFTMLSKKEERKVLSNLQDSGDDVFLQTDHLEANELFVAAMDAYRGYFADNPDDNDMRPLLIGAYQNLKLDNLRKSEARRYQAALEEDF
tara:strand:+ start:3576 stop:4520 length:945 start_codon:yes stop_codon:yes gene_type:complete